MVVGISRVVGRWSKREKAITHISFSKVNYRLCVLNPLVQMSDDVDLYQKIGMSMSTFLN